MFLAYHILAPEHIRSHKTPGFFADFAVILYYTTQSFSMPQFLLCSYYLLLSQLPCSHTSSPNLHSKSFRFSLDSSHLNVSSVDSDSPASYHRRSQWANSKNSTDQDSLDADVEYALRHRKHSHDPKRRSVHFEDDEICTNLDKEHFSKVHTTV